jgi:REP element-mobilizing transposase RayT
MSTGYKIQEKDGAHFLTFQIVSWVDLFTRKDYRDEVIDSFKYCQKEKGLNLFAYVIMSNHIHLLAQSEVVDLSGFIRDFKNYTSKRFLEIIDGGKESRSEWMLNRFNYNANRHSRNESYQFWTHENHAVILYSNNFIAEKLDYLHNNPVRAGLVDKPEDYRYSSARSYADMSGLLEIVFLDLPWKTYR